MSEIHNFSNSSHPLFVIVATHLPTSKGWKLKFGCLSRELNLGPPTRSCTNAHARTLRECWHWASQTDNMSRHCWSIHTNVILFMYLLFVYSTPWLLLLGSLVTCVRCESEGLQSDAMEQSTRLKCVSRFRAANLASMNNFRHIYRESETHWSLKIMCDLIYASCCMEQQTFHPLTSATI